jgi:hypothetical protein
MRILKLIDAKLDIKSFMMIFLESYWNKNYRHNMNTSLKIEQKYDNHFLLVESNVYFGKSIFIVK